MTGTAVDYRPLFCCRQQRWLNLKKKYWPTWLPCSSLLLEKNSFRDFAITFSAPRHSQNENNFFFHKELLF